MFAIGCSRKLKGSKQFAFIAAGETQPFVLTASETHSAAKLQLSCSIGSIAPLVRPQTHACLKFTRGFFFSQPNFRTVRGMEGRYLPATSQTFGSDLAKLLLVLRSL